MRGSVSRRTFVGTATGAVASAACTVPAPIRAATRIPPADLVVDASAPLLSPAAEFDEFQREVRGRRAAGFDVAFVPVAQRDGAASTLRNLLRLQSHLSRLADEAVLVTDAAPLSEVRPRLGLVAHFQGLQMIGEQLGLIPEFRAAGVLVMQLTGYWKNWNADGCLEPGDNALTGLGRMVVRAIAEADVVLDLAQTGRRSSLEALEITGGPVIVSRANAAAVHEHPQNLTDEQIDAVRQRGGVIGLSVFPSLLSSAPRPTLDDLLRHLDYLVERAGIDHVGLGLDFDVRPRRRFADDPLPDPPYTYPERLARPGDLANLRDRLARAGHGSAEVEKLLGQNLGRLLNRVLPELTPSGSR